MSSEHLILLDAEVHDVEGVKGFVLWRSFNSTGKRDIYSLPYLIEEDSEKYRQRYLTWINELSSSNVGLKGLQDRMQIRPGFTYWWMTLINERSYAKSPKIYDVLRLFAFEDLCDEIKPKKISIVSENVDLIETIKRFCESAGYTYVSTSKSKNVKPLLILSTFTYGLEIFKSVCRIIKQFLKYQVIKEKSESRARDSSEVLLLDYFFQLDETCFESGVFKSNYWTDLVDKIRASSFSTLWLHQYVKYQKISSPAAAKKLIKKFNENSELDEKHQCLEANLNLAILIKIIKDYITLVRIFFSFTDVYKVFRPKGSHLFLWPFYRDDWVNSFIGSTAVGNCFKLNLFETHLSQSCPKKLGIYLQENQGWEFAFVFLWKLYGHGKLIGVPHTAIQFWDLRYHHCPKQFHSNLKFPAPRPNFVAVNNRLALKTYLTAGYPKSEILPVEALRYLYLNDFKKLKTKNLQPRFCQNVEVMVLGSVVPSFNEFLVDVVAQSANLCVKNVNFRVRPHPACPIKIHKDFVNVRICSEPSLVKALEISDLVVTGGATAAALDAYFYGSKVIKLLQPNHLNVCPLKDFDGITSVTNKVELANAIDNLKENNETVNQDYFYLDEHLKRWKKITGL